MYVANLRVTHRTAPIEVIDRMVLTEPKRQEFCELLLSKSDIDEAIVLQTCNRLKNEARPRLVRSCWTGTVHTSRTN
jgi:glutamyl-tRNA reductase